MVKQNVDKMVIKAVIVKTDCYDAHCVYMHMYVKGYNKTVRCFITIRWVLKLLVCFKAIGVRKYSSRATILM